MKNYLSSIEKPEVKHLVSFQQDRNTQNYLHVKYNCSASKVALNKINGYFIDYTYVRGSINS